MSSTNPDQTWHVAALAAWHCTRPDEKVAACQSLWQAVDQLHSGELGLEPCTNIPVPDLSPGCPQQPELVAPAKLKRRRLGSEQGRAALIHAIAHIEFNAINLALDAVLRFPDMPADYYLDWLSVAADEARHFDLLQQRLQQLGYQYGDFPAHNGLWEMAEKTAHDVLVRLALVPRVLEARGLDVTPGMIEKLQSAGDIQTVEILELILREEVRHVEIGSRWFRYCCQLRKLEPDSTFVELLDHYFAGGIKPPLNINARRQADFSRSELASLQQLANA